MLFQRSASAAALSSLLCFYLIGPSWAQSAAPPRATPNLLSARDSLQGDLSPSRVTPRSLRPPPLRSGGTLSLPGSNGTSAPAGADALSLLVGDVTVMGSYPSLDSETATAVETVRGKRVTVAALYTLADALERLYAQRGYVLVRVSVPPQEISDGGTVRLVVIDGFIEAIEDGGVPERVRTVVRARAQGLVDRPGLTLSEIERKLTLAGDVPGVDLKSTLTRGDKPGSTKLVLQATYKPVSGSVSVDNRLSQAFETWEVGPRLSFDSALGLGEQIYFSGFGEPDITRALDQNATRRIVGVGTIIPIGVDGFTLNPEFTLSQTDPKVNPGIPETNGSFNRFSLRATYPVVRSRTETLTAVVSLDLLAEKQRLTDFDVNLSEDRLSIVRTGIEWGRLLPWSAGFQVSGFLSQGVDAFDTRNRQDTFHDRVPLSRLGSGPVFTKLEGEIRYSQALPVGFEAAITARGQTAFNTPLPGAERFSLDGVSALSSFLSGALSGDAGFTLRGELTRPFFWNLTALRLLVSPYLFGAFGVAYNEQPSRLEQDRVSAQSFGLGVRFTIDEPVSGIVTSATVEAGRDVTQRPERDGARIMTGLSVRY